MSADVELAPLPRGRHKLSSDAVRASQRARIVSAMIQCVGGQGYAATTVPQVVATARVSRNAFYAFFEAKADCLVAACDERTEQLHAALVRLAELDDWREALSEGMHVYLRWWQDQPELCRAFFVELPLAGEAALAARDRAFDRFVGLFDAIAAGARARNPELPPLPPLAARLLAYGITELMSQEWRAGRVAELGRLHEPLTLHALATLG